MQSTDAERLLWSGLRDRRLLGLKFRRQAPIGRFIVDFVCPEKRLIVEIDGGHHQEQRMSDASRTAWLSSRGFRVIRYWNNEVLEDIDSVMESIRMTLDGKTAPSPQPSPVEGEGVKQRSPIGVGGDEWALGMTRDAL